MATAPTSGPGGSDWPLYQTARVILESADILTLFTSPIEVIAAPDAGEIIAPLYLLSRSGAGTTPYDSFGNVFLLTPSTLINCTGLGAMLTSIPDPLTDADIDGGFFLAGGFYPATPGPVMLSTNADPLNGDFDVALEIAYITLTAAAPP